jgi:hypothetical protein
MKTGKGVDSRRLKKKAMEYLIILIAGIIIGLLIYHIVQETPDAPKNSKIKKIENDKNYMEGVSLDNLVDDIRSWIGSKPNANKN